MSLGTNASPELLERLVKIRRDPIEFLRCVRTRDEVDQKNPVKLFPVDELDYVKLYAKVWVKERFLAVPKSRRMLMSWTNIALFTWDAMWNCGRAYAFVSKKEDDSDDLVRRAKFIVENLDEKKVPKQLIPRIEYKYGKLSFPGIGSSISGFASGADQLR